MSQYHEPVELLGEKTLAITRALMSLKEEIEAVDWYNQRVAACKEAELKSVLAHNRNEEIEHACMILEWLRRNMDGWDEELRTYLFSDADIVEAEEGSGNDGKAKGGASGRGLGIGKLG